MESSKQFRMNGVPCIDKHRWHSSKDTHDQPEQQKPANLIVDLKRSIPMEEIIRSRLYLNKDCLGSIVKRRGIDDPYDNYLP